MAKSLAKLLNTDLAALAELLQNKGRGRDTVLAHITPQEAALLKARGGRGSRNPATGLLEFDDIETISSTAPAYTPPPISVDLSGFIPQPQLKSVNYAAPAATPTSLPAAPVAPNAAPQQDMSGIAPVTSTPAVNLGPSPPQTSFLDTLGQKAGAFLEKPENLLSLGSLGGLGALGISNSSKAANQAQQYQQQLSALAEPFKSQGQQLLEATQAGNLTPANMQSFQTAQAQIAQSQARGGVSSQQGAAALSTVFQTLINNQLQQATALLQQADTYTQAAINAGYQASAAGQTATSNFFTNLAMIGSGLMGGQQPGKTTAAGSQ